MTDNQSYYATSPGEGSYVKDVKTRLTLIMLATIGLAITVLVRAAYIQLPRNLRLENLARRQFQSYALIRPRRGSILDRNGEPLAVNLETHSLAANPSKIRNKRVIARFLAKSVDIPYGKVIQKLSEKREFVWIKRHLSDSQLKRFKKWRTLYSNSEDADVYPIDGVWLVKESERVYPHGKLAASVLGSVNVDTEGLEGVELWMNERMRGKVVSVSAIKDALGRPTFIDAVAAKSVQDGESVSLTLDASLQFEVEQELFNAIKKTGARSGTVIVMNATTGEILAMANEPTFNPNEKASGADKRRNRAVTDGYEPGSTLKALLMASVLSNGGKSIDQVWGERGSFIVQGHKISEAEAREKFEWVSLKKMIQLSSNVAAAKFAMSLGTDRYLKTLRAFALGSKTGLGFPGEISGKIPVRKEWGPLELANIGFGQGILVTPLQMTRAYATFLNGGYLVQPTLLKPIQPVVTPPVTRTEAGGAIRILSPKVSHSVVDALVSVTEEGGTGTKAAVSGYRVGGKTGTSQLVDTATGRYSREKHSASFIGFALDVEPKVVIYVALMEPHGNYYASQTAAPLFSEVLSSVANRFNLPPQFAPEKIMADRVLRDELKITQASARGESLPGISGNSSISSSPSIPVMTSTGTGWIIPSLKGLSPREVVQILKGHQIQLEMNGTGIVSSQVPDMGKTIAEGGTLRLQLSEP